MYLYQNIYIYIYKSLCIYNLLGSAIKFQCLITPSMYKYL